MTGALVLDVGLGRNCDMNIDVYIFIFISLDIMCKERLGC